MKQISKRLLALLLTLAMVLSLLPTLAFADEPAAEYALAAQIKNGDKVVLYNADAGKAISNADSDAANNPERYRLGVDVTVNAGKILNPETQTVWTAEVTENGAAFKDAEGHYLSVPSGYNNLVLDSDCKYWTVSEAATADSVYLISTESAGSQGDLRGIEYYGDKFTTYYASETNLSNNESAFALQLFVLQAGEEPGDEPASDDIVVLYTNDVHCGVDQTEASIGVAGLAKVKKELEAQHENVLLVDNGDFIQGELIGTISKGEYLVQLMNFLGYDYAAFGNHEYDYTMPQLKKLVDLAEAQYLSCNFKYIGEGENSDVIDVPSYEIKDCGGLKVAFVGITTPESLTKSTPTYFQDENGEWIYTFCNGGNGQELYDAVQTAVDAARGEGAQVVVALAHLGIDEQSAPWRSTDVIANTNGIDVMLDGHSHSTIARQEVANKDGETVLLSSTGTKLANIGKLTITPEGEVNTELISRSDVDGVDEETQAYLEQVEAEFEELTHQVVAHTDTALLTKNPETGARMVRMRETNLGDVCADAYRTVLEADIAFVNGGGVRADIPAGDVTYEQIVKVHPYSNMACKVKTTGQQILDALEMASRSVTVNDDGSLSGENGGFLQVSGLKYTVNTAIPSSVVVDDAKMFVKVAGQRRVEDVQVLQPDGSYAPIDPEGEYTLASHNYMLKQSGDGINMFKNDELLLDEVKVDNQVLIEYMTSDAFAAHDYSNWEGEGRITIYKQDMSGKTVILHTNDTHGALMGFAQVAFVKDYYEAMGANVILVDAGDYSQGTTYVSTNKGEAAVTMMNAAGYDFATLGNHEFDYGYTQLKSNLEKAEFEVICADVLSKEDGASVFQTRTIKEIDGVKIGFFGMETPETFTKVNPGLIQEITFPMGEEMYACAQAEVDWLKEEGADLIIGLVHLGVDAESEPNRSIDLYEHVTDIDFLIDGHSHTVMTEGPNGEPIQSTGTKASKTALMNVGLIVIDNETKQIEKNELIPLGEDAPVNETVAAAAQEIMDAVDAEYGAVFAQSAVDLNGDKAPGNRNMETNLGDLITDAMRWGVLKDMNAETLGVPEENVIAITNGGGIRAWIHKGDITMNDVFTVLPFGNTVAVVYVTGAELLEALEASTYSTPGAVGGFPQVCGMQYNIATNIPFDQGELYPGSTYHKPASIKRVSIDNINGKPFDPEATYAVITNNFCASGGDTYYVFKNASRQFDTGIPMDEMVISFIKDSPFINGYISDHYAEPQGRITEEIRFEDVMDPEAYYYKPVYWAVAHNPLITDGMDDTHFIPDNTCTREQVVTFLWRAYGKEAPASTENPFNDVPEDAWFTEPVLWAASHNPLITDGVADGVFGVGMTCTRAQVVTFLWRAAGEPEPKATSHDFTDVAAGSWYETPVIWAVENGITDGIDEGLFGPENTCTRGQVVTFLYRALANQAEPETKITFPSASNDDIAKYGNVYLNVDVSALNEMGISFGDIVTVSFLDKSIDMPFVPTFSYVDQGTPGLFKDSKSDRALVAINMGDFATTYGLATKTTNPDKTYFWTPAEGVEFPVEVTITVKEAGGYATEMAIRDIVRTNNRDDYPDLTDAEFANFRQITTTGMGDHLYRGSSPINPEIGRNTYADAALQNAGVTVIMNLANDQTTAEAYEGYADTYYAGQNIIFLNLGVDFQAADFQAGLANGLRHFAANKGVYYVHCTEGKDRAGFVSALLECLMGATCDEVVADYLKTYTNYYTVVDGAHQALSEETLNAIANSNIIKTLQTAFEVEDLKTADLAAEAEEYIAAIGLTAEEIAALKENLAGETAADGIPVLENGSNMLKYGHIDLDIPVADFLELFELGDIVTVTVNGFTFDAPVVTNYDDVDTGEYLIRCASGKAVTTLAINYGQIGVKAGIVEKAPEGSSSNYQLVEGVSFPMYAKIELKEAGGYAEELAIRKLNRTNNREDYPDLTDAEFANFRAVGTTGMGENALYRSSSPIDPELGRNTYADAAAAAAGVKTFINLADTQAEAEAFEGYTDSYYSTQTKVFLGLPVAFTSDEFKAGLADGYRFIAANEGPYLIHCLEGKDRTGLSVGVLECLMGATLAEVQADYLQTYVNYFDVKEGVHNALTDEQKTVITGIITKNLGIIFDVEDMTTADLATEAEAYLTEIGLTADEITALKAHLNGEYGGEEPTEACFVKLTEAPEDWTQGEYLLVYEVDAENGKAFNGDDGAEGNSYDTVTINNGVIAYDDALFTVTFETMEGGYAIHTANGYMGNITSGNGVTTSETNQILNELSLDENGLLLKSNSKFFRFNTNQGNDRFRYFKDNASNNKLPVPAVYVLVEPATP